MVIVAASRCGQLSSASERTVSKPIQSYAALAAQQALQPYAFELGEMRPDEVEVQVQHCGLCHSDLSVLDGEWGPPKYPVVAGHEVVGVVVAVGAQALGLKLGQQVGVGWFSRSCMVCQACTAGDYHLCESNESTILGRHGGFAERVRCHWRWATPLPEGLAPAAAGPLFCGGITVFSPLVEFNVRPLDRVAVVGIGGLGHLALQFLRAWGCEVTAFTSSANKAEEAKRLGAHYAVSSTQPAALKALRGSFDLVLVTVNVPLDWSAYVAALKPRGRLHFVGAVTDPIAVPAFALLGGQKSISGSPLGRPASITQMLDFCVRHKIAAQTEVFALSEINQALAHLRDGKARYRNVLHNDLS